MALLMALVDDLDVPSAASAQINIYTLKKADAVLTANLIQQLFFGATQGAGGLGGGAANRPLLTLTGQPGVSANLINLQITVDERSNSIIVAGSQNDLDAIAAIIARLEDSAVDLRGNHVIKLRNAGAADVANVLQTYLNNSLSVIQSGNQLSGFQQIQRNIVIAAEPVTNNLLISATPQAYAAILPIINQLDAQPLQVSIEVMIAEVVLNNSEDFGVEIGLQSPVLFSRGLVPALGNVFSAANGGTLVPGVTVNTTGTDVVNPFGFNTTNAVSQPSITNSGVVGFQGLTNYGVGRVGQAGVGGFVFSAASDTVNVLVRALKLQGRIDTVLRPTITTLDNQVGQVFVGQDFPYTTGSQATALGTLQQTIDRVLLGTTLRVTPRINPDGKILMRVDPSVSSPQDSLIPLGNGLFATAFNLQQISTTVLVGDGETMVLGGLISKSDSRFESKVPWLGDLPYVGTLFRFRTQEQVKRELLFIMTPHIIRNSADSERLLMEEARKMNWRLQEIDKIYSGPTSGLGDRVPGEIVPSESWVQPQAPGMEQPLTLPKPLPEGEIPPASPSTPGIEVPKLPDLPSPAQPKAPKDPSKADSSLPTVPVLPISATSSNPANLVNPALLKPAIEMPMNRK
ncbi:MAG: secretin N-terminal domain-containing protein [Zavarzinella sp.]